MYNVQLGIGTIGHIDGGGCGKQCILRSVDGQQDLCREDAHILVLSGALVTPTLCLLEAAGRCGRAYVPQEVEQILGPKVS
jgi:hypothetical protein